MLRGTLRLLVLFATWLAMDSTTRGQDGGDLIAIHDLAAHSIVRIDASTIVGTTIGTGWLLAQRAGVRPVVVTNRHVVEGTRSVELHFYQGSEATAARATGRVVYRSARIDFAVVALDADPPDTARALTLETGDLLRGQRVVIGGNPHGFAFQTTEGVVTGVRPEETSAAGRCGDGRNCVIVDAAAFHGSSGGPVLNRAGHVVGMLWAIPDDDSAFAFLIHFRTIEHELALIHERATADAQPSE